MIYHDKGCCRDVLLIILFVEQSVKTEETLNSILTYLVDEI